MSRTLVLRLPEDASGVVDWQFCVQAQLPETGDVLEGQCGHVAVADLAQWSHTVGDCKAVVLVPSELVGVHTLTVEGKLSKAVIKSLPYRLEEELAEDVDTLHTAVLSREGDQLQVAVVAEEKMRFWCELIDSTPFEVEKMIPEALALPWSEGYCTALQLDDRWLLRSGPWRWMACDPSWLTTTLQALGEEQPSMEVVSYSGQPDDAKGKWRTQPVVNALELLANESVRLLSDGVTLLQGEWQPEPSVVKHIKPWRVSIGLLAAVLVLFISGSLVQSIQLERQSAAMQAEAHKIYTDLFPGERVVRLQSQMRQKLAILTSDGGDTGGFLSLLDRVAPLFASQGRMEIKSVSYNATQGVLRLEASASGFETFTAFREAAPDGLNITVESLEQQDELVHGVVIIREVGE